MRASPVYILAFALLAAVAEARPHKASAAPVTRPHAAGQHMSASRAVVTHAGKTKAAAQTSISRRAAKEQEPRRVSVAAKGRHAHDPEPKHAVDLKRADSKRADSKRAEVKRAGARLPGGRTHSDRVPAEHTQTALTHDTRRAPEVPADTAQDSAPEPMPQVRHNRKQHHLPADTAPTAPTVQTGETRKATTEDFLSVTPAALAEAPLAARLPLSPVVPTHATLKPVTAKAAPAALLARAQTNAEAAAMAEPLPPPVVMPALFTSGGRLIVPPAMKGSHEILVRQNVMADRDGLDRIQDDEDLDRMRAAHLLLPIPQVAGLVADERLPTNRRYARPWTTQFLAALAKAHEARFHSDLQVNSAVRTVEFQQRLIRTNGNAAPSEGDTASPHLTGQAVDLAKHGLSMTEIAWLRGYLLPLVQQGKIDVEEEFQQACFHISVYRRYMPEPAPKRTIVAHHGSGLSLAAAALP